jgi:hypothetical protein
MNRLKDREIYNMDKKTTFLFWAIISVLLVMNNTSMAQHYTDWTGFEFEQVDQSGFSAYTLFYEITKDYTISLPEYFLDGSKLPEGTEDEAGFYESWGRNLPPCDWDFISLEFGGILTVKKGYRWDGPSYPCFLGIDITAHHLRSSLIHDALYDLMRMGYLVPDEWDAGDNLSDAIGVDNAGDYNRRMTDMLIYMIGVEDGQVIGDGDLTDFGDALTDYKILRAVGRSATHNDNKLTEWKFHSWGLAAYASDGQVELVWNHPDESAKDPNFWEHFNPFKGYTILRNGQNLMTISMNGSWPNMPIFPTSWVDNMVVNDSSYKYQVIPAGSSTNQLDWTNIDVATPVSLSGKALVLDGVDDYVEANTTANNVAFSLMPNPIPVPLTMEAWVYPEPQTGVSAILAFNTISGGNENMLFYDGDSLKFYYYDPGVSRVLSAAPSPPREWYHVAVTIDITGAGFMYIDGAQQASFSSAIRPSHGSQFSIGQEWDDATTTDHFKGRVDEVRIWKVVRTPGEILTFMNTPLRGDESGLLGLWHFDDPNDLFVPAAPPFPDSTRKAYDATVNANDGSLVGYNPADMPFVPSGAMGQVVSVDDYEDETDDEIGSLPKTYSVHQNYPNPFNPSTVIQFELPRRSHVTIEIFNLLGEKVIDLVNEEYAAGSYQITWNGMSSTGQRVSTGTYFYRMVADGHSDTKKMILLK